MTSNLTFFPVGNGDMLLIKTEADNTLLIDLNIRLAADAPDDDTPDVAKMLRDRLSRDTDGKLYVDALLVSHPDKDHCTGLRKHFHLGPSHEWSSVTDKIFIREIWSSPMVFRRASKNHILCEDAKAFNVEARRRVRKYRDAKRSVYDGDRILILGEDENGKTDDLNEILIRVDDAFSCINSNFDPSMTVRLLGPLPPSNDDEEQILSKNNSSTILQFSLAGNRIPDSCRFLTGGDAEVSIWEKLWFRHCWRSDWLSYDILRAPHHCSWHSLSYDSWSEKGEDAEVCDDARKALSQARSGAIIVSSSIPIKDNSDDPPCIRAKREYVDIIDNVNGSFKCVGEYPSEKLPDVMEFEIGNNGPRLKTKQMKTSAAVSSGIIGRQPLSHG